MWPFKEKQQAQAIKLPDLPESSRAAFVVGFSIAASFYERHERYMQRTLIVSLAGAGWDLKKVTGEAISIVEELNRACNAKP